LNAENYSLPIKVAENFPLGYLCDLKKQIKQLKCFNIGEL